MKILLVEDETICQMAISNFAKKNGHEIVVAENGLKAIEKFKQDSFNIILMDINMPEMNGYDATSAIRNTGSDVVIIALSGDSFTEEELKKYGFNGCVEKPVSKTKFESLMNTYNK